MLNDVELHPNSLSRYGVMGGYEVIGGYELMLDDELNSGAR